MPFNELHDAPEFKDWLVQTLEPMCDADPAVMSDYIIALLKHDATMPEDDWKTFITRELADFLEDHSKSFVDLLFESLHKKSFLPHAPAINPAIQPTAATPNVEEVNPQLIQAPSGPAAMRIPPSGPSASSRSHHTGPAIVSSYRPGGAPSGPIAGPSNSRQNGRNDNGDVEMQDQLAQGQGQPGSQGRKKCFDYHERGYCMRGAACPYEHDADVIIPTPEMMFGGMPFMGRGRGGGRGGRGRGRGGPPGPGPGPGLNPQNQQFMPPFPMNMPGMPNMPFMPFPTFGHPFHGANDSQGEFSGTHKPPPERTSTTLVVTDIPITHLSIQGIRDYFSKFGEITNVAIEAKSKRALVSFETNREAYRAWRSDEAVFGSRHVKVLWHRPRPGQGGIGQKALDASAGLLANMKKLENGENAQGDVKATYNGPENLLQKTLIELETKERRSQKETLMAEQKVLLKKAEGASKEEKLSILTRVKAINKEIDELDKPVEQVDLLGDKEKLDRELEKHGMETAAGKDQEELLRLNAQLTALKEKASILGIPENRYSPYGRGAPRGRARGRGRGRGGSSFPSRPMRLDNRSRTIAVTGEAFSSQEGKTSLREWYESTGGNVSVEDDGMTVTYPNREMAEKALALGTKDIPYTGGAVQATWHNPPSSHENSSQDVDMMEDQRRGDMDEDD